VSFVEVLLEILYERFSNGCGDTPEDDGDSAEVGMTYVILHCGKRGGSAVRKWAFLFLMRDVKFVHAATTVSCETRC